jgi:hypothetical protein
MPYCGMLRRVALLRTEVSEELSASIIRATGIGELGTVLAVTSNRSTLHVASCCCVPSSPILVTLMMDPIHSSETSDVTRATRRNSPEDSNLLEGSCLQGYNAAQSTENQPMFWRNISPSCNPLYAGFLLAFFFSSLRM